MWVYKLMSFTQIGVTRHSSLGWYNKKMNISSLGEGLGARRITWAGVGNR